MVMKAADVRRIGILRRKLFGAIMRGTDVWRGRLSWIPFKVLLYDDLVGVVTSRHVSKMAVTLFNPLWPKPPVIRKLHSSVFYTSEVNADKSFALCKWGISLFFAKNGGKFKMFHSYRKSDADDTETFSGPLSTVLACTPRPEKRCHFTDFQNSFTITLCSKFTVKESINILS